MEKAITPNSETATLPVSGEVKPVDKPRKPTKPRAPKPTLLPVKRGEFGVDTLERIATHIKGANIRKIGERYTRKVKGVDTAVNSKAFTITLPKASELQGTDDEKAVEIERIGDEMTDKAVEATQRVSKDKRYHCTGIKLTQMGTFSTVFKPKKAVDDLLKASAISGIPYAVLVREQKKAREKNPVAIEV